MADRIKGITIEIGGDTKKLQSAIKEANAELKNSQNNLRDIDKLLKLDPGNTELLQQKYKNLGDAIESAKDKLSTLKEAEKQMQDAGKAGTEEYDALQREIAETEQKVKSLTEEYRNFGSVASQQVKVAGEKMKEIGDGMASVGSSMTKNVTVPIAGLATAVVKTTADFDSSMSKVKAISGSTEEEFEALRAKAREMGAQTKFSASEAADAMTYMAMAGWKSADMIGGIEGIMNLAAASGEDLASTSDIVTDALTAFGLTAVDAGHFADVLAAASSNANTNVSMMGESFKYAAPIAGSLGYSVEDVSVALGIMANSGIKASQAGTSLRSIITRLAEPTESMYEYMNAWGISLEDNEGNVKSLMDVMTDLRTKFHGLGEATGEQIQQIADLEEAFSSGSIGEEDYRIQMDSLMLAIYGVDGAQAAAAASAMAGKYAMAGFLSLMNAGEDDFQALSDAVYNSSGSCQEMADIMQDNLGGQFTILMSQLQELAISFGDILIPFIREAVGFVQDLVDKLNGMDDSQRRIVLAIAGILAVAGPMLLVVGKMISGMGSFMTIIPKIVGLVGSLGGGLGSLGGVFGALASPVWIIIAAVAALAAGFLYLWNTNEDFRQGITEIWNEIVDTCGPLIDELKGSLKTLWEDVLIPFLQFVAENLAPVFQTAFELVGELLKGFLKILTGVIEFITGIFTGDWEKAWNGISKIFSGIFDIIKAVVDKGIGFVRDIFRSGIDGVKNAARSILQEVVDDFKRKFNLAKEIVKTAVDFLKNLFHFNWELPKIKLPHFSVSGEFSLNPPSIPTIGVDWYSKAMRDGMILSNPTIFGMAGGRLLGGGEAGPEAVVGVDSLRSMIADAVSSDGRNTEIIANVYIGNRRIDTVVAEAVQRNNYRSGGH